MRISSACFMKAWCDGASGWGMGDGRADSERAGKKGSAATQASQPFKKVRRER
ncbi:MAG: hypothetical protein V3U53_05820 [bacterium]